jgi:hypothetical protein
MIARVESPEGQRSPAKHRAAPRTRLWVVVAALAVCEAAGLAAIVLAYQVAQTRLTSTSEFAWFWVGMFLVEFPIAALCARRATAPATRTALLVLYGLVSYAPKLLRSPTSPAYHDEFAHWRETHDILTTGRLFQPNPIISIISRYPGLHAATAALVHATGLTIWQAAVLLLILFHVALVLGIAALAEALGLGNRTAALAAILYALNSSFLYFDTQFSYESMAITLAVWTLIAFVRAIRSPSRWDRAAWGRLTIVLSAATVVTHHLSAIALVLIMTLVALAMSARWLAKGEGWARAAVTAWSLAVSAALMAGAWVIFVAPKTLSYLSPYLSSGLSEVMQIARGSGNSRQLFGASLAPWWEQKSAYLVTALAAVMAVGGLLWIRALVRDGTLPRGRRRALLCALALLGLVYFPSVPFILSQAGAEGARRSWALSWIGLSVLAAPAAVWLIARAGRVARPWPRAGLRSGLLAALAAGLVGGTAAGINPVYRFPGPFLYGSDARSVTPELLGASQWFTARFGEGNQIVTDRATGLIFGSSGQQNNAAPSAGFPAYNLYLAKPGAPIRPQSLLYELQYSHYDYLIVDERMAYETPVVGVYFEPDEPFSFLTRAGKSVFAGKLSKFNTMLWMVKVFGSDNYSVYRLNLPIPRVGYQGRPPPEPRGKTLRGKLTVGP